MQDIRSVLEMIWRDILTPPPAVTNAQYTQMADIPESDNENDIPPQQPDNNTPRNTPQ